MAVFISCNDGDKNTRGWSEYLGGADRNHYSVLNQIDTNNVHLLKKAWEYNSGDSGQMQCNPIIIGKTLYGLSGSNFLFALDAETGEERWIFKPDSLGSKSVNRGIAFWTDGKSSRLLYAFESFLFAINPLTGKPIDSFGDGGKLSLRMGLGEESAEKYVVSRTPGTIFDDVIIMPITVGEGEGAAPGHIQAFNVISGELEWVFHTIPMPGELGYDTWSADALRTQSVGGANSWSGMAIDRKRGIIYVPTGSAAFDFYGGNRKGDNLFANSLLALDAKTGKYIWHFQTVRHDIWDRDLPAPPNLVTIKKDGLSIDAVAQVTKSGHVFIFERESGEPIYPIDNIAVAASTIPGEETSRTQPIPRVPKPFARQSISEEEITHFSDFRDSLLGIYRDANKGAFHPLDFKETLLFPGSDGGAEWGGAAVDASGIMYVNSNEMPWLFSLSLKSTETAPQSRTGKHLYNNYCISCHKQDLSGSPESGYPALINVADRMRQVEVERIISQGKGMMPGFTQLSTSDRKAIIAYIFGEEKEEAVDHIASPPLISNTEIRIPYVFNGYNKFLDENGYPAITPPWGTLTAIDLNSGEHLWQIPLGEFKELTDRGIPITGSENYGGPIVTEGGLVFIAGTKDKKMKAYDRKTGELLWDYELPAAGFATPATYMVDGKQYVVIACGGTKLGAARGDSYVAFSLDD